MSSHTSDKTTSGPKHVVMVIQRFRPMFSGQGVQLEELCRALAERGVRSTVLTVPPPGGGDQEEQLAGYAIRRLGVDVGGDRNSRWTQRFALRVGQELWRMRASVDAIHVHALTDALYTSWTVARLIRVPLLFEMTLLGDDDPLSVRDSSVRMAGLRYAVYRRCNGYVAMSGAFREACDAAGLTPDRVRVIPQAVDTTRFAPPAPDQRRAERQELGIPSDAQVVLFAGSLIQRKGLDLLLDAWRRMAADDADRWLLLAGPAQFRDPEQQAFVDRMLSELPADLARRVVTTGSRDDMHRIMQAADVLAFPTRREGFGTVMLEAMATAIPCVVTRLPGITDMIFGSDAESRDNGGVIVEQEDTDALATTLAELLADADEAHRVGAAGLRRARAEFDVGSVAARYIEWYTELMSRSGQRQQRR